MLPQFDRVFKGKIQKTPGSSGKEKQKFKKENGTNVCFFGSYVI
jgi:hypothetical protein